MLCSFVSHPIQVIRYEFINYKRITNFDAPNCWRIWRDATTPVRIRHSASGNGRKIVTFLVTKQPPTTPSCHGNRPQLDNVLKKESSFCNELNVDSCLDIQIFNTVVHQVTDRVRKPVILCIRLHRFPRRAVGSSLRIVARIVSPGTAILWATWSIKCGIKGSV